MWGDGNNGVIKEKIWKVGGMYDAAIQQIVMWLEKAVTVAENNKQKDALQKLIKYYKSGDVKDFDDYCIAWVKDLDSKIDVVNGFIEVYMDPIGKKGSFESVVSIKDEEATKTIKAIADNAQWFEDNSPLFPQHKKKVVKGISAKDSGLLKDLYEDKTVEGMSRFENVEELLNGIKEFSLSKDDSGEPITLDLYLQDIALLTDADKDSESDDKVTLMTIHAAKGLEFPHVYLVGMEENLFPSQMALSSRNELEEERRLH